MEAAGTVLVTGGAGFLGVAVVRRLRRAGHPVAVLDDGRAGTLHRFRQLGDDPGVSLHPADVCDPVAVAGVHALVRPWAVVHLAAMHFVPECERQPALMRRINGGGTACMLDAWARHRPNRFVFASSAAVYAATGAPLPETAPVAPRNGYGWSKVVAENMVQHRAARAGVTALIVRLFNLYGPAPTTAHLIPTVLAQAHRGGPVRLGDLSTVRDYVFRDDAADAVVALLGCGVAGVVNIGTGAGTSGAELVGELGRVLGRRLELAFDPARVRPRDHPYLVADPGRLRGLLPRWQPLPLAEGLRRTVAADRR